MNKKIFLYLLAFSFCTFEKSFADMVCQENSLKKSIHAVFYNRSQNSLWISSSEEATEIFSALSLQKIATEGPLPGQIKDKTLINSFVCSINPSFLKTYQSRDFAFDATNVCEESRIKMLGFTPQNKAENYGSMESGYPLVWDKIGLCTDGKNLYHCAQPTLEMQNCVRKASPVLLSPPYGFSERNPNALKKTKAAQAKRRKSTPSK